MVVVCFSEPQMRGNVVGKSDVGEVEVVFGKSASMATSLPLPCLWFHYVLHE